MSDRLLLWAVLCTSLVGGGLLRAENSMTVGSGFAGSQQVADVPLLISSDRPVHGFVMVFEWDENFGVGEDLMPRAGADEVLGDADIIVTEVAASRMILGVSMDADSIGCEMIPARQDNEVAIAKIRCLAGGDQREEAPIRLVDGKYSIDGSTFLLENLLLHFGTFVNVKSGTLVLHDGSLVCAPGPEPGSTALACGGPLGQDGLPVDPQAAPGERAQVSYYYRAPGLGRGDGTDEIQGLSVAVSHHCDLIAGENGFSLTGSVLEEVDAEFVNIDYKRDADSCEFILGVLIDANDPFDGRTLPASDQFRRLFSQEFDVAAGATPGECLPVEFTDGIQGNGKVPTRNLFSINFESVSPDLLNCGVCVSGDGGGESEFVRGDCNFSGGDGPVDIADPAAMVGFFFLDEDRGFVAPCEDACDANDDGVLDASDVVFILEYMFVPGSPIPPDPGPLEPGVDPTPDDLTCDVP